LGFSKHHIRFAVELVSGYTGKVPLAIYIKQFFAGQKKFGARDRRAIASLCYQYFRLGKMAEAYTPAEKMLITILLFHSSPHDLLAELKPEWAAASVLPFAEKVHLVFGKQFQAEWHTSFYNLLQPQTDLQAYVYSFFRQPDLFIRIRPTASNLSEKITTIYPGALPTNCPGVFRLHNGTNTDNLGVLNRDFVIQDLSSSKTGSFIYEALPYLAGKLWDCCAASGGKTIMLYDIFGKQLQYTVSDLRPGILNNLRKRLSSAGIRHYNICRANLEAALPPEIKPESMDVVLADVPCTGSGTWARTPEQHYYFSPEQLSLFVNRQKAICTTALSALKRGGTFIYITCSVFEAENDGIVSFLEKENGLTLLKRSVIDGIPDNADSMFIAIFTKC
jgi:16S rRNA (cytosine967-C5)-methyltransferase